MSEKMIENDVLTTSCTSTTSNCLTNYEQLVIVNFRNR